jgi:hypothetical protein
MQYHSSLKLLAAALIVSSGALVSGAAAADEVNMWDGAWRFDATIYAWVPWVYTTVQLPPAAGGGNPTIETSPSQYLKYVRGVLFLEGTVRKGDWALWTDLVHLYLRASPSKYRDIVLPGGDATLPVALDLNTGLRGTIWTLAPSYTVLRNDTATLDVMAGIRYTTLSVSIDYQLTAPPILARAGGFWPSTSSTDGLIGVRGSVRLSKDGHWFMPYEADIGSGSGNWQWNAILGVGYQFRWGDVTLGLRNLTYNRTGNVDLEKVRQTGPTLGATFRW